MPDSNSAGVSPLVSRNTSGEAFSKALRLYVGRGKLYSAKQVERGAGVPARLVEAYVAGPTSEDWRNPSHENLASLFRFIGPDLTTTWLKVCDQGAFWLPETDDTPPGAIAADNSDDNAVVTRAAMDGVFDREERPGLSLVGRRMMARGAQLARLAA